MIGETLDHLWQSTVFAAVAWLLTIAFRQNRAHVRFCFWFSASIKFFIPFALLITLGRQLDWAPAAQGMGDQGVAVTILRISQPFARAWPFGGSSALSTGTTPTWLVLTILAVWACGCGAIASIRLQMWRRVRAAVRASTPSEIRSSEISAVVQVRSAPGLLEPGVVGYWRPILLLPAGIEEHLTPPQLDAVLAHEVCHIRRHDNVTAAIHMISEAVFWFHPLVWWIGARLVDERERACDEDVIRLGSNPRVYAESILKTCEFYVASPLGCVTGITGADLNKRIEAIMKNQAREHVSLWKKLLLGAAIMLVVGVPVGVSVLADSTPGFGVAAVRSGAQNDAANFCCPDYLAGMIDRIRTNWEREADVAGANVIQFTIQRDGQIVDVAVEQSSGLQSLDARSRRALLATKIFDPLPDAFPNPTLTVHLNFQY